MLETELWAKKRRRSSHAGPSTQHYDTSDSDFEDSQNLARARRRTSESAVAEELASMRESITRMQSGLPPGVQRHLADALKCAICHELPMTPPIIYVHCCNRMIGCQQCVQRWEEQFVNGGSCPLYRQSGGGTSVLRGLDDLVAEIRPYLSN